MLENLSFVNNAGYKSITGFAHWPVWIFPSNDTITQPPERIRGMALPDGPCRDSSDHSQTKKMSTGKNPGHTSEDLLKRDLVDFRHLGTFREVYQERSHTIKGPNNRKSVVRMMQNLEKAFECELFSDEEKGRLIPSAFGERLFNDLRFLEAAQKRLAEHVRQVHEAGRVLHVGSSTAVFRTRQFRNLFRTLQATGGIRPSFSPVEPGHAGKALASGQCDLYLGFWSDDVTRFVTQDAGTISYRSYRRLPGSMFSAREDAAGGYYIVSLEGETPAVAPRGDRGTDWKTLPETEWLQWLDHPEKCPAGTFVLGPDVQIDRKYWQVEGEGEIESRPLQATYLRQHSYEFLPGLIGKIRSRS